MIELIEGGSDAKVDTSDWSKHKIGDRFSIAFPVEPNRQTINQPTDVGNIELEMLLAQISDEEAFFASSNGFPGVDQIDVETALKGAIEGAETNSNSTAVDTHKIEKNGIEGREVLFEGPQGLYIRARIYIQGEPATIFQANVVARGEDRVYEPEATAFLDSMEFEK